jgi:hypothetical protein
VTQMIDVKEGANDINVDVKGGAAQADLGTDKFGNPRGSAP